MQRNLYCAMVNKELLWVHASSERQAKNYVIRRFMKKFGKAELTDIRLIRTPERKVC